MIKQMTTGLVAVAALGLSQASAATSIKIAMMGPLSGSSSNLGLQLKNGAQQAVNEMKADFAKAGLTLSLVAYDDQADAATGTAAARRIAADRSILGMVGPLTSGVTIPVTALLAPSHVVSVLSTATNEKITGRGLNNVNRVCARDDAQGVAGGNYLAGTLKAKRVYILNDKTPYGQGLAAEAEKALRARGVTIVQSEGVGAEERDFTALLTKIRTLRPDAVYFGGLYGQIGPFLKQLRDGGVTVPVMGGDGLDSSDLIKLAGSGANNVYFTSLAPDVGAIPAAKALAGRYHKSFGSDLQGVGVISYDAARVLLQGILNAAKTAGNKAPTREQVERAVRTGTYRGLMTGTVKFDRNGDRTNAQMYVVRINQGKRSAAGTVNIRR